MLEDQAGKLEARAMAAETSAESAAAKAATQLAAAQAAAAAATLESERTRLQASAAVDAATAKAADALADLQRQAAGLRVDLESARGGERAVREEWTRTKAALQAARDEAMAAHALLSRGTSEASDELAKVRKADRNSLLWTCCRRGATQVHWCDPGPQLIDCIEAVHSVHAPDGLFLRNVKSCLCGPLEAMTPQAAGWGLLVPADM